MTRLDRKKHCINEVIVSTFFPLISHFLPMLDSVSDEPSVLEAATVAIFCVNYWHSQICRLFFVPRTTILRFQRQFSSVYKEYDISTSLNFCKALFQPFKNSIKMSISRHYINVMKSVFCRQIGDSWAPTRIHSVIKSEVQNLRAQFRYLIGTSHMM